MRKWLEKDEVDQEAAEALAKALDLQPLTASLLLRRGVTNLEEGKSFLNPSLKQLPDPTTMKDMNKACKRIVHAIVEGERIVVYGDYDVDGVTSTSLLMLFLRELGVPAERLHFFIPNRVTHGYGLQKACIPEITALGCDLLITVDCGITSREEIGMLAEERIDTIVIDHHLPKEQLPDAFAILNPHQTDCLYPDKRLAAVGVTYQMIIALRAALRDHGFFKYHPEPNLRKYIDLVALGTVADIVPLLGVNRILVHHGLKQMKQSEWVGLCALLKIARVKTDKITAGSMGFQLGPRINAAGRLHDASLGVRLLLSQDKSEAEALATQLDQANQARKEVQEKTFEQARGMLLKEADLREASAIVLAHEDWHPGIVGIVASKLVDEFHRPTILIAIDPVTQTGKGSCRSIPTFHIEQALRACQEHLIQFGGHAAAAGVSIKAEDVAAFRDALIDHAETILTPDDLVPRLSFDAEIGTEDVSEAIVIDLERLEPHGMGNPRPVLVAHNVTVLQQQTTRDGKHLQLMLEAPPYRSLKAIAFGKGALSPIPSQISIAYVPELDEWRGRRKLQLNIKALRTEHTPSDGSPDGPDKNPSS